MRKSVLFFLGLNIFAILMFTYNYFQINQDSNFLRNVSIIDQNTTTLTHKAPPKIIPRVPTKDYRFSDPLTAQLILKKLDIFENGEPNIPEGKHFKDFYFGLRINNAYCDEHRAYFTRNSDAFFGSKHNFFTDYWTSHKFRSKLIPKLGKDMHPKTGHSMSESTKNSFSTKLNPEIHIFYTQTGMWFSRLVGKQFSCLTQISNHCPGHENLSVKDKVGQALVNYAKGYKSKPQCFNTDKFFPETWVMLKPDQCREFFEIFNSPEYLKLKAERNIVYMRKIGSGVHQGKGVFPVTDEDEQYIRNLYANGTKCESVKENNIIQNFIHNPLLLLNRKFHFRVFMYIASTNPFIAYYHDGYLRISFQEYDKNSKEMGTFVTNLGMTDILFQNKVGVGNKTATEIKGDSYWYYPQFHKYLMEQGMVDDPDWLDNYLRAEMKKAMVHLIRMSNEPYWRKSSLTELYGVDFMMDENLNLWFIEANSGPLIQGWDDYTTRFFNKLLTDSFEISFGLLKSRAKRIIEYINGIIAEKNTWSMGKGEVYLKNLEEIREEFRELTMNRFEPEFEPSPENGFQQIIDETQEGTKRYLGLIEEECL